MPGARNSGTYPSDFDSIDRIHIPLVTSSTFGLGIEYDTTKSENTHLYERESKNRLSGRRIILPKLPSNTLKTDQLSLSSGNLV